jgi:hypothetical protein
MDPTTLLLAAITYTAALVGRKVANEVADGFWSRAKQSLQKALGKEPIPTEVSKQAIATLGPELQGDLNRLLGAAPVLRRARIVEEALNGGRVLWIDDNPAGNSWEYACLTALGCRVKTVESTRTAVDCLRVEAYDLVLSDIARAERADEGLKSLPTIRQAAPGVPVIFYVMALQGGVPAGAFGITNHPDELLHLCMDAMERRRF